jgi:hypothetical protein
LRSGWLIIQAEDERGKIFHDKHSEGKGHYYYKKMQQQVGQLFLSRPENILLTNIIYKPATG